MDHSRAATLMAILCLGGGLAAFVRKGSVPSIVGGSVVALLFATSAATSIEPFGRKLAVSASLTLTAVMAVRAIKTRKLVPIVGLALGALASGFFAFVSV